MVGESIISLDHGKSKIDRVTKTDKGDAYLLHKVCKLYWLGIILIDISDS